MLDVVPVLNYDMISACAGDASRFASDSNWDMGISKILYALYTELYCTIFCYNSKLHYEYQSWSVWCNRWSGIVT